MYRYPFQGFPEFLPEQVLVKIQQTKQVQKSQCITIFHDPIFKRSRIKIVNGYNLNKPGPFNTTSLRKFKGTTTIICIESKYGTDSLTGYETRIKKSLKIYFFLPGVCAGAKAEGGTWSVGAKYDLPEIIRITETGNTQTFLKP